VKRDVYFVENYFQFLLDRRHPDPSSFFYEGQTLEAKVTEVDQTKFRFLLSLRMMDCYHGDVEVGLRLLGDYLAENQLVLDRLKTADGKCSLQEGQHPLTGQHAANFRLLANQ